MREGQVVQTVRRIHGVPAIPRGTRGKVRRVLGQWAFVDTPSGGRIQVHESDVAVILKNDVDL